jgi:DNA polymerase
MKELVCADFSQIESRVLAWLAGQQDILDVFASGQDVYVHTAKKIGSNNRQLGKVCVLGLGFGMGWSKFIDTAALMGGLVLDEDYARDVVKTWRDANYKISAFWRNLDDAFRTLVEMAPGSKIPVGHVVLERGTEALAIRLPAGRKLIYRNPRLEPNPEAYHPSKTDIVYDGVQQYSKKWGAVRTYGGKIAENVTQAVARDVMAAAMLELDAKGVDLRLTVHDEIIAIASAEEAAATLELVLEVMRTPPPWAHDLPVNAEGWHGRRYKK